MQKFTAYIPTKLHFGQHATQDIGNHAAEMGHHALLVYGCGSAFRNGSYSDTVERLQRCGVKVTEYGGIKPNPLVDDVEKAARLGRERGVDLVVAVGGGSVLDSAKVIAVCIADAFDPWEVMMRHHQPQGAVPILAVLTLAATGTEMNPAAVIQNPRTKQKLGFRHELMYPTHSYLDPTYTLSVPRNYTAYGVVDLVCHCLEAWFGAGEATLSDRFTTAIIQEAIAYGPALIEDLTNFDLRSKIMWAATNALNNMTIYGRSSPDWGVHILAHTLSVLYDTAHGATLSIIYPAWLKVMRDRARDRIVQLGEALFDTSDVDTTIRCLESFFAQLGSPIRCQDAGIDLVGKSDILDLMNQNQAQGLNYTLTTAEREAILDQTFAEKRSLVASV
ncbi:iron-containing alcohol dehydrogenase [Spirulina major CS-329]|uniref:iron-containing alcohol dehydrogenase n=1 Tax=Spirulina TaxID=1154 RepID=UPI00232B5DFE|nr:iron-containing alcohol dehydrogenase [Spirulina major]MDB9502422.1 iron-containing alcohol dehydrogenase [Spirulina major CS-329]